MNTTQTHKLNLSIMPAFILILAVLISNAQAERVFFNGTDFKDGYYDIPDDLPKDSKVWVFADVHGARGLKKPRNTEALFKLLAPEKVIILVPALDPGYQGGRGSFAKKFIANFEEIKKKHKVHDKMFIHGFSGGAQFVHRFAMYHPKYVIGVSAASPGSWATGGDFYGDIKDEAKGIPFAISCGENDTKFAVKGSPHNRIEWYKLFDKQMKEKKFIVGSASWPAMGHRPMLAKYGGLMKECFLLSTQGIIPESKNWSGDVEKIAKAAKKP